MKKLFLALLLAAGIGLVVQSCSEDFITKEPQGALAPGVLANADGLEALLIAAYAQLDGWAGWSVGAPWTSAGSNWVYGDVYADDAYKGSDVGDQADILNFERYVGQPSNPYSNGKWRASYDGISRCNDVLRIMIEAEANGSIDAALATQIKAEARFLRGHYHFEATRVFGNVPYVDELNDDGLVPNTEKPYRQIEEDFQFAIDNLPSTGRNGQVGRATSHAANSLMGKVKLAQGDYGGALPFLNAVIGNFTLTANYHDNFRCDGDNNSESIFQIQNSINDGSGEGANGNYGDILNFPYTGGPGQCCGFYQPTQNLVNAYKTSGGLPMISTFNDSDVDNDQGLPAEDPFTEFAGDLDPRLDWAVGRRGIPYLDWGDHPGITWIRDQAFAGPYSPKKNVFYAAEQGACSNAGGWGGGTTGNNHSIVRYADVLLMAAECEVEAGGAGLENARGHVNEVRMRAADSAFWVKNDDGSDAANYVINTYDNAWTDQGAARDAVRMERRLELSMEGHRFFDLKRWGVAKQVLNDYLSVESTKRTYLAGSNFEDKHLVFPIPQSAIDDSKGTLTQNPGY